MTKGIFIVQFLCELDSWINKKSGTFDFCSGWIEGHVDTAETSPISIRVVGKDGDVYYYVRNTDEDEIAH